MTATNTTDTFEFLWQTTRQRNEARQIAALLPRIPRGVQAIGSSQLACQLLLELDQWEVLADDPASTVYQATDARTGRDFAVKCLGQRLARRPECVRLFEAEMATCAGLSHPGVPQLQGVGRLPDGRPFFVMDFVHGPTIAQWRGARREEQEDMEEEDNFLEETTFLQEQEEEEEEEKEEEAVMR